MTNLLTLFRSLSDESRLRILNLLLEVNELCVCDIQSVLGITQTKASRHLAYLKHAGLVTSRRSGLWMIYSFTGAVDPTQRRLLRELSDVFLLSDTLKADRISLQKLLSSGCCAPVLAPMRQLKKPSAKKGASDRTPLTKNHSNKSQPTDSGYLP